MTQNFTFPYTKRFHACKNGNPFHYSTEDRSLLWSQPTIGPLTISLPSLLGEDLTVEELADRSLLWSQPTIGPLTISLPSLLGEDLTVEELAELVKTRALNKITCCFSNSRRFGSARSPTTQLSE